MNFFRIAGTSEAETLVSGKAEYLLDIPVGEDYKSKLSGVTFSFKYMYVCTIHVCAKYSVKNCQVAFTST